MIQPDAKSVARFAHDVAIHFPGGDWSAFIVRAEEDVARAAAELASSIEQFASGASIRLLPDIGTADQLLEQARGSDVLVIAVTRWPDQAWRELDLQRARIPADRVLVFVMSEDALLRLTRDAPNLYSLVRAPVRERPDEGLLTDLERQQRIVLLQERTGRTSAEVIEMAEAGRLPPDPEYGEWLLLLERGDLL